MVPDACDFLLLLLVLLLLMHGDWKGKGKRNLDVAFALSGYLPVVWSNGQHYIVLEIGS